MGYLPNGIFCHILFLVRWRTDYTLSTISLVLHINPACLSSCGGSIPSQSWVCVGRARGGVCVGRGVCIGRGGGGGVDRKP